jgi:pimeloyl-ACP methyl ester carboxylesterase
MSKMSSLVTTGTVTSADGTPIAFSKLGNGPALVLVDGAFCYRENGPSPDLAPLLARQFTVYTYDRRGRGESGDTPPYAVAREIEDLAAVLRETGESAYVFGVSSGAVLALQGAAAGLPVRKLALYEPPLAEPRAGAATVEESRRRLEQSIASNDRAGAVRYFMRDVFGAPRAFVLVMPLLMPKAWANNVRVAHTLPYDFTLLGDRSIVTTRAGAIDVPTLVVGGAKSPTALQDGVRLVAEALPNARALLLPGQSHDVSAAAPALVPALAEFFAESASPASAR